MTLSTYLGHPTVPQTPRRGVGQDDFGNEFDGGWGLLWGDQILGSLGANGFATSERGLLWEWELARKEVV